MVTSVLADNYKDDYAVGFGDAPIPAVGDGKGGGGKNYGDRKNNIQDKICRDVED